MKFSPESEMALDGPHIEIRDGINGDRATMYIGKARYEIMKEMGLSRAEQIEYLQSCCALSGWVLFHD